MPEDAVFDPPQGAGVPRIDGRAKVTGEARYPADVQLAGAAHAVLVTADVARGRIAAIRADAVRRAPGVLDVLTHAEVGSALEPPRFGDASTAMGPLHDRRIRHDGQIVALVVAETPEQAAAAAALLEVEYADVVSPSAGFAAAGAETVAAGKDDIRAGDCEAGLAAAPVRIEAAYATPAQHHNAIELFSTGADWRDGRLTVHEPSQNVKGWQHEIARQLRIDPAEVRVLSAFVGGAFGGKGPLNPRTAIVALAARRLGRPVRCIVGRAQGYTTATYRAETRHAIRMGAGRDGRIAAFSHEAWELTSRSDDYVADGTGTTCRLYGYGAVHGRVHLVRCDRGTPGYMRAPAEMPYMFALECAMDEMATALAMDPIAFRRINDAACEPVEGRPFSSRPLLRCFAAAADAFGWAKRDPRPGSMRSGDWLVGYGCASAVYPANVGAAAAAVRLGRDGRLTVRTAAHEIGTGVRTVAARLAAQPLGLDAADVTVETGDSDLPPAPVAGGSNSTASVGSAVALAAVRLRGRLAQLAAAHPASALLGADSGRLRFGGGRATAEGGASVALGELVALANERYLEAEAVFTPPGAAPDAVAKLYEGQGDLVAGSSGETMRYAFGGIFAEVRIHRRTREIRVPRLVGAFAAGRVVNPTTARSQLVGGMLWGLGTALHEATEVDPRAARYINPDLHDYLIPVNADAGQVQAILLDERDEAANPAGIKGVGELGNVGTPAAIANAAFHATGRRVRDLPIRIEDLLGDLPTRAHARI